MKADDGHDPGQGHRTNTKIITETEEGQDQETDSGILEVVEKDGSPVVREGHV